jgi:hypothetical protein
LEILGVTLELEGWDRMLSNESTILIRLEDRRLDLIVACAKGWAVMRSVDVDPAWDAAETEEHFSREIRITLGQLDEAVHESIKTVCLWRGSSDASEQFQILEPCLQKLEWPVTRLSTPVPFFGESILLGNPSGFEYLPPTVRKIDRWLERFSTRKNLWLSTVGGGIVLLVGLAFLVQGNRLNRLESRWVEMKDVVEELEGLQGRIRFFRSWFDSDARSLQIARHLAETFPADGDVWIKELEINRQSEVFCSGLARNNQVLLALWDKLGESPSVGDLKVQQVRGESQVQFAFNFNWKGEANHED